MSLSEANSFQLTWGEPTHGVSGLYTTYTSFRFPQSLDYVLSYHIQQGLSREIYASWAINFINQHMVYGTLINPVILYDHLPYIDMIYSYAQPT